MRIIANKDGFCDSQIFNLGNPDNECSIKELAEHLAALYESRRQSIPDYRPPRIEAVRSEAFYGSGYQDILTRKPSIAKARRLLGWEPQIRFQETLARTFDAALEDWLKLQQSSAAPAGPA